MKEQIKTNQALVVGIRNIKKGSLGWQNNRRRGLKKEEAMGKIPG